MYRDTTFIRKASSGEFGKSFYHMASIVWRWNHPDNPKAQIRTKGWPNQRLYNDLLMFYFTIEKAKAQCEKEDRKLAKRSEQLAETDRKVTALAQAAMERKQKVLETIEDIQQQPTFIEACEYYGVKVFVPEHGKDDWEERFLRDIKHKMIKGTTLSEKQVQKLWDILEDPKKKTVPATQKQKDYLIRLGYEGDIDDITKHNASKAIKELRTWN